MYPRKFFAPSARTPNRTFVITTLNSNGTTYQTAGATDLNNQSIVSVSYETLVGRNCCRHRTRCSKITERAAGEKFFGIWELLCYICNAF